MRYVSAAVGVACLLLSIGLAQAEGKVKIFLMIGQSNMEGHGRVETGVGDVVGAIGGLRYQVNNDPANYGHLVDGGGNWIERDDVWIWSTTDGGEKGKLTPGFGVSDRMGPELGFGNVIGDLYDDQVLLIKTAWGGKSLAVDFRPPSAVAKRGGNGSNPAQVGFYYNEVVRIYNDVVANIATEFPDYAGQGVELEGIAWHQGWNDRVNQSFNDEYEANMVDFIHDIRDSLNAPGLPFVLAETGMSGFNETHPRALSLMAAQAAMVDFGKYPQHEGNVDFVGTKGFYREASVSPRNQAYHWNQNGETYYLIGDGLGDAMAGLVPEPATLGLIAIGATLACGRTRRRH